MSGAAPSGWARGVRITTDGGEVIVDGLDLEVAAGTIVGVAGETGSGKSTLGLALLGFIAPGLELRGGTAQIDGHTTLRAGDRPRPSALRDIRGRVVSYVPQDPGEALDPVLSVGASFAQVVRAHLDSSDAELEARRAALFAGVGLPTDAAFSARRPHELSGGQQQRVAIAIALALEPALIVMDEPTTGLDVSTKHRVVQLVRELARGRSAGILFVSHDLPLLLGLCDRVVVMRHGRFVEEGETTAIRTAPRAEYTRRLLEAVPRIVAPPEPVDGAAILRVRGLEARHGRKRIVAGVDLDVIEGSCTAVIGESGSGKTTLARSIAGIHRQWIGEVRLHDKPLAADVERRSQSDRAALQYVFQSPWGSLNPRRTVGGSIAVAARRLRGTGVRASREAARQMLDRVGLSQDYFDVMPQRLSGGQRQRAALARGLVARPQVLICDEVTSSLDVSVQDEVMSLLEELREQQRMTLLFITHDLALATRLADHTVVLRDGQVVESGATRDVLGHPGHEYTIALVEAMERSWARATPASGSGRAQRP